jgi:hypothetical protein
MLLLCLAVYAVAVGHATVFSVSKDAVQGTLWSSPQTWVGGVVPCSQPNSTVNLWLPGGLTAVVIAQSQQNTCRFKFLSLGVSTDDTLSLARLILNATGASVSLSMDAMDFQSGQVTIIDNTQQNLASLMIANSLHVLSYQSPSIQPYVKNGRNTPSGSVQAKFILVTGQSNIDVAFQVSEVNFAALTTIKLESSAQVQLVGA